MGAASGDPVGWEVFRRGNVPELGKAALSRTPVLSKFILLPVLMSGHLSLCLPSPEISQRREFIRLGSSLAPSARCRRRRRSGPASAAITERSASVPHPGP